ncbi:MAG: gamma-glutamyl-gamma-aminobutyrate hydrolase family protein [Steroidobacteraceae bacterium]
MNVAHGGTLWQAVQDVGGHMDHREDKTATLDAQYAPAHDIYLEPGSQLAALAGHAEVVRVNSLHSQGVRALGRGLAIEARAPDGLIEAFRVESAAAFALAVQWHPEWHVLSQPLSQALFAAFGAAARERAARHRAQPR